MNHLWDEFVKDVEKRQASPEYFSFIQHFIEIVGKWPHGPSDEEKDQDEYKRTVENMYTAFVGAEGVPEEKVPEKLNSAPFGGKNKLESDIRKVRGEDPDHYWQVHDGTKWRYRTPHEIWGIAHEKIVDYLKVLWLQFTGNSYSDSDYKRWISDPNQGGLYLRWLIDYGHIKETRIREWARARLAITLPDGFSVQNGHEQYFNDFS